MSEFAEPQASWDDDRLARIHAMVLRRLGQTGFFSRDPEALAQEVEDAAQDVMVRLMSRMRQGPIEDLENFALGIAKKVLLGALRDANRSRLLRDREMILAEVTEGDVAMVERHRDSARAEIAECLARHTDLEPDAIEFVLFVFLDEMTSAEAAKRMSLSSVVAKRLRERVRRAFSKRSSGIHRLRAILA
ncbi:MAG: sigma-70 family RNA polymerase sigma factor [Planctomycetes bacterium]|nr:sigma-70 family RNA polymerase sigma factor [Planctomycetota bacterium]